MSHSHLGNLLRFRNLTRADVGEKFGDVAARKWATAGECFVESDAKTKLIGALVRRLSRHLLGRHVRRGSHHELPAQLRGDISHSGLDGLNQAKIEDVDPLIFSQHDVRGFEVAVNQPGSMGGRQAPSGGGKTLDDRAPTMRAVRHPLIEGAAVDPLTGKKDLLPVQSNIINCEHVGVRELGHGSGLPHESALEVIGALVIL